MHFNNSKTSYIVCNQSYFQSQLNLSSCKVANFCHFYNSNIENYDTTYVASQAFKYFVGGTQYKHIALFFCFVSKNNTHRIRHETRRRRCANSYCQHCQEVAFSFSAFSFSYSQCNMTSSLLLTIIYHNIYTCLKVWNSTTALSLW